MVLLCQALGALAVFEVAVRVLPPLDQYGPGVARWLRCCVWHGAIVTMEVAMSSRPGFVVCTCPSCGHRWFWRVGALGGGA